MAHMISNAIFAAVACFVVLSVIAWVTVLPTIGLMFVTGYMH